MLWLLVVSLFSYSYRKLLVAKYCSKWEKSQEAKRRSTVEQRPICELERVMDVDLFLEAQGNWPEDSPLHLVILHEMFLHAASERTERGRTICLPRCLAANAPAEPQGRSYPPVELVGPETSRDKLLGIYLEVYKLHRLPGSPLGEPAIVQEVLANVPDCHQRGGGSAKAQAPSSPEPPHPSNRGRPHQESSVDRSLAKMQEAHQQALSTTAALEKEIGRLDQMRVRVRLRSQDHWRSKGEGQKKRHCQASSMVKQVPSQSADPEMLSGEEGCVGRDSDLGELPELKPAVA